MGQNKVASPLYVCVYIAEFAAQALLRLRPEMQRVASVVMQGAAPLEEVFSMNTIARRMGVESGMSRAELDSFSGLTLLRRSIVEETTSKVILVEVAGAFTPRVEVHRRDDSAFAMTLDMSGSSLVFGAVDQCIQKVATSIAALRFSACIAASANVDTAICLAPMARTRPIIVPSGEEAKSLSPLPVASLGLTAEQAETFKMWGLQKVGEVAALPESDLVARMGQGGKRLHLLARGRHPHLMMPEETRFTLEERIEFDAPVESLESLLFVLGPMVDQLLIRAQNRAFALASLTCMLKLDGGGEHSRTIKPALPLLDRQIILKLLHLDLQAHPPGAGVLAMTASAEPGDRSKVQLGLFSPQLPEPTRLDVTLARIEAIVGEGRVGRARLLDAHGPERFVVERFAVPSNKSCEDATSHSSALALRRFRPPVELNVHLAGATLRAFFMQGMYYDVCKAFGPWRRSGAWWSHQVWSVEEWDVRAQSKTGEVLMCLITHDLLRKEWKLAALYD